MNARRKAMKIPILPPGWEVYHKGESYTIWQIPKVKKGHGFKQVVYDGCNLDMEEDHFYFSTKPLQDTVLQMYYLFKNNRRKIDSTIFTFRQGNHDDTLTREQAEHILAVNGIDKDY